MIDILNRQIEYDGPLEIEAYLRKVRISKRNDKREKTSLKYFRISLKEQKLSYKNHKSLNAWRMEIPFSDFIRFIPYLGNEHRGQCEFRYGFQLLTKNKYFVLYCEEEMFNYDWVKMLEYVVNERELTYDNYEKFIVSQANREYEAFINENNKQDQYEDNRDEEFSFSNNLIKDDGDFLEDSVMLFGNNNTGKVNPTKIDSNNNDNHIKPSDVSQIDKEVISAQNINKDNNIYASFQFQSFNNNNNNVNNSNKMTNDEPVLVDNKKSRPIHDLSKYKIQKDQITIKPTTSKMNINDISYPPYNKQNAVEKVRDVLNNEKPKMIMNPPERAEEQDINKNNKNNLNLNESNLKNEISLDLFNDKDEISDFLNFDFDQLNVSKSYRAKSDKVIPISIPSETHNKKIQNIANNNLNNPIYTSKHQIPDENILDPSRDFLIDESSILGNTINIDRDSHNNLINSKNNMNTSPIHTENKNKTHSKNSSTFSNSTNKPIITINQNSTATPIINANLNINTYNQIPTPKSQNSSMVFSNTNTKQLHPSILNNSLSSSVNNNIHSYSISPTTYTHYDQNTPYPVTPNSKKTITNANPFPSSNTYIPKKISSNKTVNNSLNSQSSINSNQYNNSDKIGNYTILSNTSISKNLQRPKKDQQMYDSGQMHIKQNVKKEKVNLENLNFGIDDYKMDIDKIPYPVIGSLHLDNSKKQELNDESNILENIIKKKKGGARKKLTPEDSLLVLKNIKKASTNNNVILEESLKEEGNTWVLNVKIKKYEKI